MHPSRLVLAVLILSAGCTGDDVEVGERVAADASWDRVAPVLEASCAGCHQPGDIAPFPLTTHAEAADVAALIGAVVEAGTMPPWPPAEGCNEYLDHLRLEDDDRDAILAWVDAGAPGGSTASDVLTPATPEVLSYDIDLRMAEPYAPTGEDVDDYRCFVVEWPETTKTYITGFDMLPDRRDQVHHVIAYAAGPDMADAVRAGDAADPGPGYTCYGGPLPAGRAGGSLPHQVGGWVPGMVPRPFPEGTGLPVEPGSVIILQMHYNVSAVDPGPDQSAISFAVSETVERPALSALVLDPLWVIPGGMPIPAGNGRVVHDAYLDPERSVGLIYRGSEVDLSGALEVHQIGMHMHQLGSKARVSVARADGSEDCMLQIDSWDFNWQGRYRLAEPVRIEPDDQIHLQCEWDNSAGASDVQWGDGTSDEMCLSGMYFTAP